MHLAAPRGLRRAGAGLVVVAALFAALARSAPAQPAPVRAHAAVTCADHPDQAAAQRAADTRDPDGDGLYCVIYSG